MSITAQKKMCSDSESTSNQNLTKLRREENCRALGEWIFSRVEFKLRRQSKYKIVFLFHNLSRKFNGQQKTKEQKRQILSSSHSR